MTHLELPDNRELSIYTGYTRDHWIEITRQIVAGYLQYVDRKTGIAELIGADDETALQDQLVNPGGLLEAIDRPMMAIAAWMAATGQTQFTCNDGCEVDLGNLCRLMISAATDQDSRTYRRLGSLAGITLSALMLPDVLLKPLDDDVRQRLIEHCLRIYKRPGKDNNTLTFRMMPIAVLEYFGIDYDHSVPDDDFDTLLSMYRGDGWFIDGWNRGFDHYNFWGFMMYFHAFMKYIPRYRQRYGQRILEITREHEKTLPYYFGKDGSPIPKGRSINYRFAVVSGIGYSQWSGLTAMHPGLARRISSGCLKYFWEHGCLSRRGIIEPGWWQDSSAIGEDYTDRAAAYWSATGLAAMALPADHPFWNTPEQPMPADSPGVKRCLIKGGQMLLKVDGDRGEAKMFTVGEPFLHRRIWQAGSKYFQHAYSSTLGHALAGDLGPELGAGRTGISADGKSWAYRTWPRVVSISETRARSEFDAFVNDESQTGTVVTESIFLDRGEIHLFWHTSDSPRYLTIGGYSVQADHGRDVNPDETERQLTLCSDRMWSVMKVLTDQEGELQVKQVTPRPGFRDAHLFGGWSSYMQFLTGKQVEAGEVVAVFVDAGLSGDTNKQAIPDITVDVENQSVQVVVDGSQYSFSK